MHEKIVATRWVNSHAKQANGGVYFYWMSAIDVVKNGSVSILNVLINFIISFLRFEMIAFQWIKNHKLF